MLRLLERLEGRLSEAIRAGMCPFVIILPEPLIQISSPGSNPLPYMSGWHSPIARPDAANLLWFWWSSHPSSFWHSFQYSTWFIRNVRLSFDYHSLVVLWSERTDWFLIDRRQSLQRLYGLGYTSWSRGGTLANLQEQFAYLFLRNFTRNTRVRL